MSPGRYTLIIVSHGNAGSLWSHHDLATSLARQGNIVITLSHPGDNYKDQSGAGAASTLYARHLQIYAAITAALSNPDIRQHIDADKIAFIGFSSGGETGLVLAGGKIDPSRYLSYCEIIRQKSCVWQKGILKTTFPLSHLNWCPRIIAWVLMAPVSAPFAPESLKTFTKPTLIFIGDKDEELSWRENAGELAKFLPAKPQLKVIPGAGRFVFLAPRSTELRNATPLLCEDPLGIDRVAVHSMIENDITRFLSGVY